MGWTGCATSPAGDHGCGVAGQRDLAGVTAERSLPDVAMGVDQAGHHHTPAGIHYPRTRRTRRETGADSGDPAVADEHVALREVADLRVERHDMPTADEEVVLGHSRSHFRQAHAEPICLGSL